MAFYLIAGFISICFAFAMHEYAHGLVAYQLGDPTAKYEDRLTPNPFVHLDPVGALVMLATIVMSQGKMVMGWAKPVRFDQDNLKNPKLDTAVIAFAGPFANFVLAFFGSLPILLNLVGGVLAAFFHVFVLANLAFGIFNLLPVPPLDGWKVLGAMMPDSVNYKMQDIEESVKLYALVVLLFVFYFVGDPVVNPLVNTIMNFLFGRP